MSTTAGHSWADDARRFKIGAAPCDSAAPRTAVAPAGAVPLSRYAWTESVGGASAGVTADMVLYGIDSYKVRLQSGAAFEAAPGGSIFRGLVPSLLLGSVPTFGLFFLVFAPARELLNRSGCQWLTPLAATTCAVPASIIAVPSDLIKKRLVLGVDRSFGGAVAAIVSQRGGWRNLFLGWRVNVLRDVPFATVKVGLYELTVCVARRYAPRADDAVVSSCSGVLSGAATALLTCPLDVVNTRIKGGTVEARSILGAAREIARTEGACGLFRGVGIRAFIVGLGSAIFWPIQTRVASALLDDRPA
ncbi:mitochondrial carrier domain-containing protein [Pelagophyceae sp. CCMP2097]|nr:mitochondrial carrier domain-containing protein [Pelagophyceae sp. CCMP2097]